MVSICGKCMPLLLTHFGYGVAAAALMKKYERHNVIVYYFYVIHRSGSYVYVNSPRFPLPFPSQLVLENSSIYIIILLSLFLLQYLSYVLCLHVKFMLYIYIITMSNEWEISTNMDVTCNVYLVVLSIYWFNLSGDI